MPARYRHVIPPTHKPYAAARAMANRLALMTDETFRVMMPAADSRTMPRLLTSRRWSPP